MKKEYCYFRKVYPSGTVSSFRRQNWCNFNLWGNNKSKNDFYSILALNTIIEKNLILDKNKILNYFDLLETSISSKENADLIRFKSIILDKKSDRKKGKQILEELINKDSSLKIISQEIIKE